MKNLLEPSNSAVLTTSPQLAEKLRTDDEHDKPLDNFGLSEDTIARYVRVNDLYEPLKTRLDSGEFAFIPAVLLTYLNLDEQAALDKVLKNENYKVTLKYAERLKEKSDSDGLDVAGIVEILTGKIPEKRNFGAISRVVTKHFVSGEKTKEIKTVIDKALTYYFKNPDMFVD